MTYRKIFNCQKCDAEMEVTDPAEETLLRCRRCGGTYRLVYNDQALSWMLRTAEPVASDHDFRPEDESFSVFGEVSRPAQDDRLKNRKG